MMNKRQHLKYFMGYLCIAIASSVSITAQTDIPADGLIAYAMAQQPCEQLELPTCPVDIAIVNPVSEETTILSTGSVSPTSVEWSPNFDMLLYIQGNHIFVIDITSEEIFDITDDEGAYSFAGWSPDGKRIAFISESIDTREFYIVDVVSMERETIATDFSIYRAPFVWSPDGDQIAFMSFDFDQPSDIDIYIVNADGTSQINVIQNPADDLLPSWSSDGKEIAFLSGRDGEAQIYAIDLDTKVIRQLTTSADQRKFPPEWALDDSHILYGAFKEGEGNAYLYLVDTETLETKEVLRRSRLGGYDISPDGTEVVFVHSEGGDTQLCILALQNLTERCLDAPTPHDDAVPTWGY